MQIKFTQSARKHRIGKSRALYVIENNFFEIIFNQEGKFQQVWIGIDDRGLELEIVAVVLEEYLLVTHVMPTNLRRRKKTWGQK